MDSFSDDSDNDFPTLYAVVVRENGIDIGDQPVRALYIYTTRAEAQKALEKRAKADNYNFIDDGKASQTVTHDNFLEWTTVGLITIEKITKPGRVDL